jgi:hypothetical protein
LKIGDQLMAEEDGGFWPFRDSPRQPQRLVVKVGVVWTSSSVIRVKLPETKVMLSGKVVALPETKRDLPRHAPRFSWRTNRAELSEASEWHDQLFYPKVHGLRATAERAHYYTEAAWRMYQSSWDGGDERAGPRVAPDPAALGTHAHLLGLTLGASREQVVAAFREKAKVAHPDHGGDPTVFRRLIQARDAMLAFTEK